MHSGFKSRLIRIRLSLATSRGAGMLCWLVQKIAAPAPEFDRLLRSAVRNFLSLFLHSHHASTKYGIAELGHVRRIQFHF